MKIVEAIRQFMFIQPHFDTESKPDVVEVDDQQLLISDALAHYCEFCKRGFRTKAATKMHKRKHG